MKICVSAKSGRVNSQASNNKFCHKILKMDKVCIPQCHLLMLIYSICFNLESSQFFHIPRKSLSLTSLSNINTRMKTFPFIFWAIQSFGLKIWKDLTRCSCNFWYIQRGGKPSETSKQVEEHTFYNNLELFQFELFQILNFLIGRFSYFAKVSSYGP